MGFKISYQQKSEYRHCPKCNHLLILYNKDKGFIIGHNMNFCYNCGQNLKEGKDIIDLPGSWDFDLIQNDGEFMLYDRTNNKLYTDIPEEICEKYSSKNIDIPKLNISKSKWNYDYIL